MGGLGLAAYVLVAWREPSKVSVEELQSHAQKMWNGIKSTKDSASGTWTFDGFFFRRLGRVRGREVRGPKPPEPLDQTCEALRDYPGIEAIRRLAFPIMGDEPPGAPR